MIGGGNNQNGPPSQSWMPPPKRESNWSKWGGSSPGLFSKTEPQTKRAPISVFPSATQNVVHLLQRPSALVTSKKPPASPVSVKFPKSFDQSIMREVVKPYFESHTDVEHKLQDNNNLTVHDIQQSLIDEIFDPGTYQQKLLDKKKVVLIYISSLQKKIKRFDSASFFKKQEELIQQKSEQQYEKEKEIKVEILGNVSQIHKAPKEISRKNSTPIQNKTEITVQDISSSVSPKILRTVSADPNEIPKITSFFNKNDSYITTTEENDKLIMTVHAPSQAVVKIPMPQINRVQITKNVSKIKEPETHNIYENKLPESNHSSVWSTVKLSASTEYKTTPTKNYSTPNSQELIEAKKEDETEGSLKRFGTQSTISQEERERIKRERKRLNSQKYRAEAREIAKRQREEMRSIPFNSLLRVVQNITSKGSNEETLNSNEGSSQPTVPNDSISLPKPLIEKEKHGMDFNLLHEAESNEDTPKHVNDNENEKTMKTEKSCEQPISTMASPVRTIFSDVFSQFSNSNSNQRMSISKSTDNLKGESKGPQLKQLRAVFENNVRKAKDASFISTRIREETIDLSQITRSENESEKEPTIPHSPSTQILQSRPSIVNQLKKIKIEATAPTAGVFPKPEKELAKVPLFFRREEPEPKPDSLVPKFFDSELSDLKESDIKLKEGSSKRRKRSKRNDSNKENEDEEPKPKARKGTRRGKKADENEEIILSEDETANETPKKRGRNSKDSEIEKAPQRRRGRKSKIDEEIVSETTEDDNGQLIDKEESQNEKPPSRRRGRRSKAEIEESDKVEVPENEELPIRRRGRRKSSEDKAPLTNDEVEEAPSKKRGRKAKEETQPEDAAEKPLRRRSPGRPSKPRPITVERVDEKLILTVRPPSLFVHLKETEVQKEASSLVNRQTRLEDFGVQFFDESKYEYGGTTKPMFEPEDPNDL